jgi:tape measure domain-containing protein
VAKIIIEGDSTGLVEALKRAETEIGKLSSSVDKIGKMSSQGQALSGLGDAAKTAGQGFSTLASAVNKLDTAKVTQAATAFKTLISSLRQITNVAGPLATLGVKLKTISNGIRQISAAANKMSGIKLPTANFRNLATSLEKLKTSIAGININGLTTKLQQLQTAMASLSKLSNIGGKINATGFNNIAAAARKAATAINQLVSAVDGVTTGRLNAIAGVLNGIQSSATKAGTAMRTMTQKSKTGADDLNTSLNNVRAAISSVGKAKISVGGLQDAVGQIRNFISNLRSAKAAGESLKGVFQTLGGLLAGLTVAHLVTSIFKAKDAAKDLLNEVYGVKAAFEAINVDKLGKVGAVSAAEDQIEHIKKLSFELGTSLKRSLGSFRGFVAAGQIAGQSVKKMRDAFDKMQKVSTVLHLKPIQMQRAFMALEQMFSKGKISTEELRRQLGEVIPGAVQLLANQLGVSTQQLDKLLRTGKVGAENIVGFIDKVFDKYKHGLPTALDSPIVAMGRLHNAWEKVLLSMAEGFGDITKGPINEFASALNTKGVQSVAKFAGEIVGLGVQLGSNFGSALAGVANILGAVARLLSPLISGFSKLVGIISGAFARTLTRIGNLLNTIVDGLGKVGSAMSSAFNAIGGNSLVQNFLTGIKAIDDASGGLLSTLGDLAIAGGVSVAAFAKMKKMRPFDALKKGASGAKTAVQRLPGIFTRVVDTLGNVGIAGVAVKDLFQTLRNTKVGQAIGKAVTKLRGFKNILANLGRLAGLSSLVSVFGSIGRAIAGIVPLAGRLVVALMGLSTGGIAGVIAAIAAAVLLLGTYLKNTSTSANGLQSSLSNLDKTKVGAALKEQFNEGRISLDELKTSAEEAGVALGEMASLQLPDINFMDGEKLKPFKDEVKEITKMLGDIPNAEGFANAIAGIAAAANGAIPDMDAMLEKMRETQEVYKRTADAAYKMAEAIAAQIASGKISGDAVAPALKQVRAFLDVAEEYSNKEFKLGVEIAVQEDANNSVDSVIEEAKDKTSNTQAILNIVANASTSSFDTVREEVNKLVSQKATINIIPRLNRTQFMESYKALAGSVDKYIELTAKINTTEAQSSFEKIKSWFTGESLTFEAQVKANTTAAKQEINQLRQDFAPLKMDVDVSAAVEKAKQAKGQISEEFKQLSSQPVTLTINTDAARNGIETLRTESNELHTTLQDMGNVNIVVTGEGFDAVQSSAEQAQTQIEATGNSADAVKEKLDNINSTPLEDKEATYTIHVVKDGDVDGGRTGG